MAPVASNVACLNDDFLIGALTFALDLDQWEVRKICAVFAKDLLRDR